MYGNWESLRRLLMRFGGSEDGPTATEYAVMLALIIVVSVAVIQNIGESFLRLYTIIAGALPSGLA
jgi:pilus assembly protein Flp/PilA